MRVHPQDVYAALKAVTRKLVRECGGTLYAETRVGKTKLAEYGSANAPECFAPIDVIADLERDAGPIVTAELARIAGYVLTPTEAAGPARQDPNEHVLAIAEHLGELSRVIREAQSDGRYTAAEIERLRKEAEDIVVAANRAFDDVCRLKAGQVHSLKAG